MKMYLKETHGALCVLALVLCGAAHAVDETAPETAPLPFASAPLPESAVPEAPRAPPPPPPPEKPIEPGVVRVPYVPEIVKQQIRDQVRAELRADVVQDVLTHAKEQRWGVPGVLPDWIERIKLKGDFRVRAQGEFYDRDNGEFDYFDFLGANRAGGFGKLKEPFVNTREERHRLRERIRIALEATPANDVKVGIQISSGNTSDPVSTNQTLGNTGGRYQVVLDQAYLKYDDHDADRYPWLTIWAGRLPNPWLSTDLVWDGDLAFEGLAATYRYNLHGSSSLLEMNQRDRTLFFTAGAFPIQEVALSARDKWLFGTQLGTEFIFRSQSVLKFALGYYDYVNITGKLNAADDDDLDYTAPDFMQKGNTLFDIRNDLDEATDRWALASDYNLIDFALSYDMATFAPYHLVLALDYVKNIGYDKSEIQRRTGGAAINPIDEKNIGYQLQFTMGWPLVLERGKWRVSFAYKYLQRDAVLDAFTDSDFHLGGTNAKGFMLGGSYALYKNTWLSARWMSSDEITGLPLSIDVFQVDLNAKF